MSSAPPPPDPPEPAREPEPEGAPPEPSASKPARESEQAPEKAEHAPEKAEHAPEKAERASVRGEKAEKAKRPRYLVVALVTALIFGAGCWTEGCDRLTFYQAKQDNSSAMHAGIKGNADRERAEALYHRFTEVAYATRGRVIPMSAALFVIGAALLALASRGLAGKHNTRGVLMQVVVVQAALVVASHFLTRERREAELDWGVERTLIELRETAPPDQYAAQVQVIHAVRRFGIPGWLAVRTLASALIVLALTRPRAREFFDAAEGAVPQ